MEMSFIATVVSDVCAKSPGCTASSVVNAELQENKKSMKDLCIICCDST